MRTVSLLVLVETRPQGAWIGEERLEELAQDGFVLQSFGDVREIAGNAPLGAWYTKYVFYRTVPSLPEHP